MKPYMKVSAPGDCALRAEIVSIDRLEAADRTRMFELMRQYYDRMVEERFLLDLANKHAVILLRDEAEDKIRGFSTLRLIHTRLGNKRLRGVFSGDTVIEKHYWGQRTLGKAFLRFLFFEKLKRPLDPLYWLLISKGYKTYLMMANNFSEHYPRFERPTPASKKAIIDAFYAELYPSNYDPKTGLIEFSDDHECLKSGVANISNNLLASNRRIAFFQKTNPQWMRGVELACIARMSLFMPFYYALKVLVKDRMIQPTTRLCRLLFPFPKERSHTNE